ncbi:BglG family transcription antiterminator [Dellaglioa sp. L3N]
MRERLNSILNRLISSKSESINDLSIQFEVTPRTIRNEMHEINDMLASNQFSTFQISKGIIYNHLSENQQKKLTQEGMAVTEGQRYLTPQQRILYLLIEILASRDPIFIIDIQEQLEISKSTMDGDMRDVRMLLQTYNLRLVTNLKSGASIVGNERTIRMMFCDLIIRQVERGILFEGEVFERNNLVDKLTATFTRKDMQFINQEIMSLFATGNLANNISYRYQASILTLIWVIRIQNKHVISEDLNSENVKLKMKQSQYINELITYFNLEIDLNSEIRYMAFIISSFDKNEDMVLDNWMKAQVISVSLIESMEETLGLPFSKSESLFEDVYYHISSLLVRYGQHLNVFNPLKTMIKQSYPEIYTAVCDYTLSLRDRYNLNLSDDENGYLAMYFSVAQVEIKKNPDFKYRTAVVCNYGMATGKLLAAKLEERFDIDVIAVLSSVDINILKKLRVDLVFKTVDIDIEDIPNMKVNPIPSDKELESVTQFLSDHAELSRYEGASIDPTKLFNGILAELKGNNIDVSKDLVFQLQRVFYTHHLNINEREVQPMLKDIVSDDQIQLNKEVPNWQEAIKVSAQPLIEQNFISDKYVEAMISSVKEYGPYIVIGPSIALAHARPEDGANKLGVSITTLKNPVNFGSPENDPVSIVFCLAAIDNYSHLNVMKAIVQLINDPKKVEKLKKQTKLKQFKKLLFNEREEI